MIKKYLLKLYYSLPRSLKVRITYVIIRRGILNLSKPSTFNEKINYRKLNWKNTLFPMCSDKIAVRDYVADKIGAEHLIEKLYEGLSIEPKIVNDIIEEHGAIVIKANHNSGPVQLLEASSSLDEIIIACDEINNQLKRDYGNKNDETWYSHIKPKVLIEKKLIPSAGHNLNDYKFHVFNTEDGENPKIILQIDFDRNSNHTRTIYDEDLNPLPFAIEYPSVTQAIDEPKNYKKMLSIVKSLAKDFSYARVDLYNIDGDIYFGEITFAHGSGYESFTPNQFDNFMGSLWQQDPRL